LPVAAQRETLAATHRFEFGPDREAARIETRIDGLRRDELTLALPVWKPGAYEIRPFHRQIRSLTATGGDGKELAVSQPDPSSWQLACAGQQSVVVRYDLLSVRNGVGRTERVETSEGFKRRNPAYLFEGPAVWLYVKDRLDVPQRVTFALPDDWQVATGMGRTSDPRTFTCPDYDTFADCPFHVGALELLRFEAGGVPHEISLAGFLADRSDRTQLAERWRKLVEAQLRLMGPPPYDRYVFLASWPGGSGLEHLNSTNMSMMELAGSTEHDNSSWDGLVSHEFFHLWNVKRLRPKALGPFDYSGPNRTRYLWFCEGVTSYYGDLTCVRAGVWNARDYWLETIAGEITTLQNNPGRLRMSVADASWTVWDGPYMRRGRNVPDYYNKGQLLGLLLDIEIRDATDNHKSLDDVMRGLYGQCVEQGRGFEDGDVRKWCEKVAGRSFERFFADYVDGVAELPFRETLRKIAIDVERLAPPPPPPDSRPESQPESRPTSQPTSVPQSQPRRRAATWVLKLRDAPERGVRIRESMTR
jgi:predicted metalloprotease with PDZ domain